MSVTNLTNTTWLLNLTLKYIYTAGQYNINFTQGNYNVEYDAIVFGENNMSYKYVGNSAYNIVYEADRFNGWLHKTENERTVHISGGADVEKPEVISWLETNGELISTGEEETPKPTKKFTRLYLGAIAQTSNGKRFRKLQYTEYVEPSEPEEPVTPYLTFSSPSSFTLATNNATKNWDGTLEYSTDASVWNTWDGTTTLSADNGNLYLRGIGNTVITGTGNEGRWVLSGTSIACSGNIETLLDYETVASGEHPTMANHCFQWMFNGCTNLTKAPELPANTLTTSCYNSMFKGCTGLTEAPVLPATTLAVSCYTSMFYGCTNLTEAPELPATILTSNCYQGMFKDCTKLNKAFDLQHVTSTEQGSFTLFVESSCSIHLGKSLANLNAKSFYDISTTPLLVNLYYHLTDEDVPAFDTNNILNVGSSKATRSYNIYTDNTVIKDAALAKVDTYTIVNVYHLDGSEWEE